MKVTRKKGEIPYLERDISWMYFNRRILSEAEKPPVQSLRAAENFRITGLNMHPEIINSLAYIKKASAITNCESGILEKKKAKAIVQACDEILTGKLHEYFIVDPSIKLKHDNI